MKVSIWRALAASPGWAHMMSMSSGDFTMDGGYQPAFVLCGAAASALLVFGIEWFVLRLRN